jgi:hypothetical protein
VAVRRASECRRCRHASSAHPGLTYRSLAVCGASYCGQVFTAHNQSENSIGVCMGRFIILQARSCSSEFPARMLATVTHNL